MQADVTSFWEWQQHFSDEKCCLQALTKLRWPEGFQCESCGHRKGWLLQTRPVYECAGCHQQTSITAGTVFPNTKLPLVKWFWCLYWVSTDKGSIRCEAGSRVVPRSDRAVRFHVRAEGAE